MALFRLGLMLVLTGIGGQAFADDKIRILSTPFPPYVFASEDGVVRGPAATVIHEAFTNAGIEVPIELLPWARSYAMAEAMPNTFIFSIARRPDRETHFAWIGTVAPYQVKLFKLRDSAVPTASDWNGLRGFRIAGQLKDVKALFLKDHGFEVYFVPAAENTIKMLYASRVDLVPGDALSLPYRARLLGLNPSELAIAADIPELSSDLYLAAQPKSNGDLLERVRVSLQKLKDSGRFEEIWRGVATGS